MGLTRGYLNMVFVSVRINYIALSLLSTCKPSLVDCITYIYLKVHV